MTILLLVGSQSDLKEVDEKLDKFENKPLVQVASADRTHCLFREILTDFDIHINGIIAGGGLAFVAAAYLETVLKDVRKEKGNPLYSAPKVPTIFVPRTDSVSGGITAYTSISQSPPGASRASVGLGQFDVAYKLMQRIVKTEFDKVNIWYDNTDAGKKIADSTHISLEEFIGDFKIGNAPATEYAHSATAIDILASSHYFPLEKLDAESNLLVNVGAKQPIDFNHYLSFIGRFANTVHVSLGGHQNAAMWAAYLLAQHSMEIGKKIDAYYEEQVKITRTLNRSLSAEWECTGSIRT